MSKSSSASEWTNLALSGGAEANDQAQPTRTQATLEINSRRRLHGVGWSGLSGGIFINTTTLLLG
jgi:hypothetical protein